MQNIENSRLGAGLAVAATGLIILALSFNVMATQIHVPADFTTIQAGIDASVSGDTVYVSPGTYVENINFLGKNILLKSTDSAAETFLEPADAEVPIVRFLNSETRECVIDGFTVRNAISGRGIDMYRAAPTIRNCHISYCRSGLMARYSAPLIEGNVVDNSTNVGIVVAGVGLVLAEARNNLIRNSDHGVVLSGELGPVSASNNVIDSCNSGVDLLMAANSVKFTQNVVTNSESYGIAADAGGLFHISNNTVVAAQIGIAVSDQSQVSGSSNIVTNCDQSAIVDRDLSLRRSLLWNNNENFPATTTPPAGYYTVADPKFVSAENGDYSLLCESPAIDNGDPSVIDLDGSHSDIGAVPFQHDSHVPSAMNFTIEDENLMQLVSPLPTFVWEPSLDIAEMDTLFCIVDSMTGDTLLCGVDTVLAAQSAFELQVGLDDDWTAAELFKTGEVISASHSLQYGGPPLTNGQSGYARLRLRCGDDWGCWRTIRFRRNAAPSTPVHRHPNDGSRVFYSDVRLAITWLTDVEFDGRIAEFELFADEAMSIHVYDTAIVQTATEAITTALVPNLVPGQSYWWRARSFDSYDYSEWSEATSFHAWSSHSLRVPEDYSTIQEALEWAADGDSIMVGPGTYSGNLNFREKAVCIIGVAGAESTSVLSGANGKLNLFSGAPFPASTAISGFHFLQSRHIETRGFISFSNCIFSTNPNFGPIYPLIRALSGLRVSNCEFRGLNSYAIAVDMDAPLLEVFDSKFLCDPLDNFDERGLIYVVSPFNGNPQTITVNLVRNLFVGNGAFGMLRSDSWPPGMKGIIENNTVVGTKFGVACDAENELRITNNILVDCSQYGFRTSSTVIDYNNFFNVAVPYLNTVAAPHDISVNPQFVDQANGDYRLQCGSLCIDAGNPGTPGCIGKAIDIGAFEYDYEIGNANGDTGDNVVNLIDVVFLVNYIFGGGPAPCPSGAGNINCDDIINISDAIYLIGFLYAGGPEPCGNCR